MRLHELKPHPGARRRAKRVGRGTGSGHGKTSGRGQKGQGARSGGKKQPWFEGGQTPLVRRVPKRGFKNPFRTEYAVVNVADLARRFEDGAAVTPESLDERGLIRGRDRLVKILGDGELSRPLEVRAHAFSRSAVSKIEAAGGKVEVLPQ